jgi:tetratricopeptide (TPR) repeat protein
VPLTADVLRKRAYEAHLQRDFDQAVQLYGQLVEVSTAPLDYACYAQVLHLLGRYAEAADFLQRAYKSQPTDPFILLHLALLKAACPESEFRDGEMAVELATSLCALSDGKNWLHLSILAAAYAEVGQFEQAIEAAHAAYELAPIEEKDRRKARIEQYRKCIPYRCSPEKDRDLLVLRPERQ